MFRICCLGSVIGFVKGEYKSSYQDKLDNRENKGDG